MDDVNKDLAEGDQALRNIRDLGAEEEALRLGTEIIREAGITNPIVDEDPGDGGAYPDHVVNGPKPEVAIIPQRYGKSITLSVTTKEPENWSKLWAHFSEMGQELGTVFPAVHLNSYDLDALGEEDEDKPLCVEEHLYHDDLTVEKFKTILRQQIASTYETHTDTLEEIVGDIVNILHNNRMLIRERKPLTQ